MPPDALEREIIANSWANEAKTLRELNLRDDKHIVRFITAFTKADVGSGKSYFLMFEWADGGSLERLFATKPNMTGDLVKRTMIQLLGLAEALKTTHELGVRHGDIKPTNILHFNPADNLVIGTLKIGDWGLAKCHTESTARRRERGQHTKTRFGNLAYEPPEVELGKTQVLSRRYDIWSIGCVMFEILIWLLYGYEGLNTFRSDLQGGYYRATPWYVLVQEEVDGKVQVKARLQEAVEKWMDTVAEEAVCDTDYALGGLLVIIRRRLLIAELPTKTWRVVFGDSQTDRQTEQRGAKLGALNEAAHPSGGQVRATSAVLVALLGKEDSGILDESNRPNDYWLRDLSQSVQVPNQRKEVPTYNTSSQSRQTC